MEQGQKMNLYQKLVQIRKQVRYIKKEGKGYNFNYATGADLICEIRTVMDEMNVILFPDMESFELVEVKKGTGVVTVPKIVVSYTWVDADNPSDRLTTRSTYFEDKMTGCQSIGSMQTYAERYFLYKFFQIAVGSDDIEEIYKEHKWNSKNTLEAAVEKNEESVPPQSVPLQASKPLMSDEEIIEWANKWKSEVGDAVDVSKMIRWLQHGRTKIAPEMLQRKIHHWDKHKDSLIEDHNRFLTALESKQR